jgi:hypothetical protein
VIILALLILGSVGGLFATLLTSTAGKQATLLTSTAGKQVTATANAPATREPLTGSVNSCPASGPVGATISVSSSGWSEPDGEQVSLGYMIASYCSIVSDAQTSTFKSGSFSGWLHLPNGTPLGTYSICATFGSTTAVANTYTVLTEASPQIRISLSTQTGVPQATITGSNYFPAGTTVNLFWETTNGSVLFTITPAVSNSNGLISRTYRIPTTVASGSYKIVANVGGQQPTLSSSVTFTYNTLTPTPTPSPTPLPASDPTPTQHLSPTAVTTAVATPILTPTIGATMPVGSQHTNTGQTPSSGTTSNTSSTKQPTRIVIIGSIIGSFVLLATILIIVLFIRRKKARSVHIAATVGSTLSSPMTWQNNQVGSSAPGSMPYPMNNGSMTVSPPWPVASTPPSPQKLQISPYAHLLQQPEGGSSGLTSEPTKMTSDDPNIESIKRQVQMGLFATPGNRRDD